MISFPLSAITGQDKAKKALMMLAVNESLHSVLLSGEKGTGKSVLVRGFAALLPGKRRIDIPLNITEDRLLGGVDLEYALKHGKKRMQAGVLASANRHVLAADDLNLMGDAAVHAIVNAVTSKQIHVEREGMSISYPSDCILVATMNPVEGELAAGVLDRFGLYVAMTREQAVEDRRDIIRSALAHERNPVAFMEAEQLETLRLQERITTAKGHLSRMEISGQLLELAALTALNAHCPGHRADYYLVEAAKAISALDGRDEVEAGDIRMAAEYVLLHRMGNEPNQSSSSPQEEEAGNDEAAAQHSQPNAASTPNPGEGNPPDAGSMDHDTEQETVTNQSSEQDKVEAIGAGIESGKLVFAAQDDKVRSGTGKRSKTKTGTKQGRYLRAAQPKGKAQDIAIDATLRAAAPFQRMRPPNEGTAWSISREDIRVKVREKRVGVTMMFVVDASRSMAAEKRMQAVKGAILSLLQDAYQKRDRVGMIAFRQESAEEILSVTRSVELAEKQLRMLPTGGKTPLASGLMKGIELLRQAVKRDPEVVPIMVVITDGKANVGLQPGTAMPAILAESRRIGSEVPAAGIHSLVLDTEQGFVKLHLAQELAAAMQAQYVQLAQLDGSQMAEAIRDRLKI